LSTYGELKSDFAALLNRRDSTPAQHVVWLQMGLKKVQRSLRIPAMEKAIVATIGNLYSGGLAVPGDLLKLISITNNDTGDELERKSSQEVLDQIEYGCGDPRMYFRRGSKFVIGPTPVAGTALRMDYYAQFAALSADSDSNVLTDIAPDLMLYAGLVYAGLHFNDKRTKDWGGIYGDIYAELMKQGEDDELTGNAQVSPAFRMDLDEE